MAEQIRAEWGTYVGWNLSAILLVLVAAKWPKIARLLFSVLFLGAGVWNLFASLTMPAFYVETYGPSATPPYAAFITGPFAANPALFVVPIAVGQLAIGILAAGTGARVRLAMLGSMAFLLAIAPMGVGRLPVQPLRDPGGLPAVPHAVRHLAVRGRRGDGGGACPHLPATRPRTPTPLEPERAVGDAG